MTKYFDYSILLYKWSQFDEIIQSNVIWMRIYLLANQPWVLHKLTHQKQKPKHIKHYIKM